MGIVKRQALQNSIFNFLGQFIGYVNVALLFPILLSQDEFGLTRLLGSMAILFAQLSSFGAQRVIIKFFPLFRSESSKHHGFLTLILTQVVACFLIVLLAFFFLEDYLIERQGSALFARYYYAVPWLAFLTILYWVLETYLRALFKTSLTSFLNNIVLKFLWLGSAVLYYYGIIQIDAFILIYCSAYAILGLVVLLYLIKLKQFSLAFDRVYFKWRLLKQVLRYGANSILDDTNTVMMNNIDKIMIGFMLNLESLAVYTVASYLSTVISVPSASMNRILVPLLSNHWKKKEREKVIHVYRQSTALGLVLGGSIFVLIWANIDSILAMIDKDYVSGIYVIFFLMLARIADLAFGLNGDIILVSRHYWFNTASGVVLVILMIVFNLIFIPVYGFTGAAFGTLLAKVVFNLIKYVFLKRKENLDPFTMANVKGVIVLTSILVVSYYLHFSTSYVLLDLAINGTLDAAMLCGLLYFFRISEDVNEVVDKQLKKIKKRL